MTWIKTVLLAIVGIKDILKVLKQIWAFSTEWYRQWQNRRASKKMAKAIDKARKTKDTSDIENLFNGK